VLQWPRAQIEHQTLPADTLAIFRHNFLLISFSSLSYGYIPQIPKHGPNVIEEERLQWFGLFVSSVSGPLMLAKVFW